MSIIHNPLFHVVSQSLSTLSVIEEFLSKRDVPFFPGRVTDPQKPSRWARNKSYFRESITSWPEKSADISRRHHLFTREMTSEIERRNSIMMTCHYPDLGSASDWLKICFRKPFLRRFAGNPVEALRNVGCYLRIIISLLFSLFMIILC